MLTWLYNALHEPGSDDFISKLANVFQYQTFRAITACLLAFIISLAFGSRVIRKLISLKMGQPVRTEEEVHKLFELHGKKAGTPTMGGILIIGALIVATLLGSRLDNPFLWVCLFVTLGLGALGFVDDWLKVSKKNSKGVSSRGKLAVQWVVGLAAGYVLYKLPGQESYFAHLQLPFIKKEIFEVHDMGWFTVLFFAVIIVGCSNAVNLTDGLDGLAAGCTVSAALAYGVFCYFTGNHRIQKTKCGQRNTNYVINKSPKQVLPDFGISTPRNIDRIRDQRRVTAHQGHTCGVHGNISTAGHCYTNARLSQCRSIINTIANHGHQTLTAL